MEFPDEPDGHRDVQDDQQPVAGEEEEEEDDQLEPQLWDVPEVETAATFLSIEIVTLQIWKYSNQSQSRSWAPAATWESDDKEYENKDESSCDQEEQREQPNVSYHLKC